MAGVQARTVEEKKMEILLPSLVQKGYIDDTELQNIMFKNKLEDRQLEIYKLMMVKEQKIAVKILNALRKMISGISARKNYHENHPLLTEVVADCIFEYLPTNDILSCRLVCRQWKTASKNILRKRVTIVFETTGPSSFLNDFQNTLPTDVPFQNFNFAEYAQGRKVSEVQKFFDQWGPYIKKLTFKANRLFSVNRKFFLDTFDLTPWILKATNLTELYVANHTGKLEDEEDEDTITSFKIQLSQLNCIKHLSFYGEGCLISIEDILRSKLKIKPLKISMDSVIFLKGRQRFEWLCLNCIFDFSEATEIRLSNTLMTRLGSTQVSINMEGWFVKAQYICLSLVNVRNWTETRGTISFFDLDHPCFAKRYSNSLKIQQIVYGYANVYLSALPTTIEKVHFSPTAFFQQPDSECRLPNLKYLRFDECSKFYLMSSFTYCSNLVEIELGQSRVNKEEETVMVNVHWIPKSVKRLKINSIQVKMSHRDESEDNVGEDIQDDGYVFELDTLILEDYLHCLDTYVCQIMTKIKPLVLVVTCMDEDKQINTTTIYDFVCANKQLEKIVVGSTEHLHKNTLFNTSALSQIVKEEANYYVFENLLDKERNKGYESNRAETGKPISYGEFCNHRKMNGLDRRYCRTSPINICCKYDWEK